MPNVSDLTTYIMDGFMIAIMSFVLAFSLENIFARKHKYDIDPNQEMFAFGMVHVIGSFFGCIASTGAPPRCTMLDTTGTNFQ